MKFIVKAAAQLPLEGLIAWLIETDVRFNSNAAGIRMGVRIENAVEKSRGKPYVELADDQHEHLRAAAEKPSSGYPPLSLTAPDGTARETRTARPWLPLIDAICEAKDEPPVEPAVDEPAVEHGVS